MMKKILAVAIASAFAAPAFAATANVDVYGQINASVENVDNGADSWNRMVTNNNSFIGFKGSEDLGSGLKAVWQIEANLEITGNGSAPTAASTGVDGNIFGTRNTFIGLAGGWGTAIIGTHDTPYKLSTGPLDLFVGTLGGYNGIFGSAGSQANSNLFDLRTGNTIAYMSPTFMGGLDVKAAYVMGLEGVEPAGQDASDAYSLAATYKNGPLFVTGAYEKHMSVGTSLCVAGATCLGSGVNDRDAWKVGAGFTFGNFKIGGVYESMDGDGAINIEHDTWGLMGGYQMGAFLLKASYAQADDVGSTANSGTDMWAVGADYAMSKRTKVQLTYAMQDNDSNGVWGLGQGASVANGKAGEAVSGFSLGMVHSF